MALARVTAQQEQSQCLIRSPASGGQVRGQFTVAGVATHPDFTWYQMGYAPDPNPDGKWNFFWSSETAVPNGQLGVWDTTQIADGTYQLILEVHRKDGNNEHCFVGQIRVNNTAPTPTFTAAPLPTAADTPTPLPTLEATPTVVIEQPPTATPRPTPTYSSVDNPTPTPEMTRLQTAHRSGQRSQCLLPRSADRDPAGCWLWLFTLAYAMQPFAGCAKCGSREMSRAFIAGGLVNTDAPGQPRRLAPRGACRV